jgi:hypothetical protein
VEIECGLPFYFKHKKFQKVVDYPPFESVIEIGDHPPLVKVLIYIFLAMSIPKEGIVLSMEEIFVALKYMQ